MRFLSLIGVVSLSTFANGAIFAREDDYNHLEDLVAQAQEVTKQGLASSDQKRGGTNCSLKNLSIRKEWLVDPFCGQ